MCLSPFVWRGYENTAITFSVFYSYLSGGGRKLSSSGFFLISDCILVFGASAVGIMYCATTLQSKKLAHRKITEVSVCHEVWTDQQKAPCSTCDYSTVRVLEATSSTSEEPANPSPFYEKWSKKSLGRERVSNSGSRARTAAMVLRSWARHRSFRA